ncbi:hypothetical protein FVE85_3034 [Porphyridium purpureum]|uniref:Tbc2 translation factor, chloroplastic n=1 Tax=Porphyridium purpureum TaxID=35688 RepID=A0A5J4YVN3_PORPP|nr:hypothetical protein FVE85_3034 [Porphyridium purpureum]|eukprot:POR4267..scf227_4
MSSHMARQMARVWDVGEQRVDCFVPPWVVSSSGLRAEVARGARKKVWTERPTEIEQLSRCSMSRVFALPVVRAASTREWGSGGKRTVVEDADGDDDARERGNGAEDTALAARGNGSGSSRRRARTASAQLVRDLDRMGHLPRGQGPQGELWQAWFEEMMSVVYSAEGESRRRLQDKEASALRGRDNAIEDLRAFAITPARILRLLVKFSKTSPLHAEAVQAFLIQTEFLARWVALAEATMLFANSITMTNVSYCLGSLLDSACMTELTARDGVLDPLLPSWCVAAYNNMYEFQPQGLINVMWVFHVAHIEPPPLIMERFWDAASRQTEWTPGELHLIFHHVGRRCMRMPPHARAVLGSQIVKLGPELGTGFTAFVLWGAARGGFHVDEVEGLAATVQSCFIRLHSRLRNDELARCIWAIGELGVRADTQLSAAIVSSFNTFSEKDKFSSRQLVRILTGVAQSELPVDSAHWSGVSFAESWSRALERSGVSGWGVEHVVEAIRAAAMLRISLSDQIQTLMIEKARTLLPHMDHPQLCALLIDLADLNMKPNSEFLRAWQDAERAAKRDASAAASAKADVGRAAKHYGIKLL